MLRLENVTKQYKGFTLNCSMEVKPGVVTGLIGANGAGKSTTFKAILGLIHTECGEINVFGKSVKQLSEVDKANMGVALADSGFSGYLSIKDLLPVLANLYPEFDKEKYVKYCERFNLPLNKKIKDFSTGMKRKLHVITAISHNAKLVILDEPTAGMDVIARDEILGVLREYMETEGRSVLISSHISSDLEGFCDDIYMIHQGEVIFHEDTDVLLDEYALLKVTKEQYESLDKTYILRHKKESFGYRCLTNEKQFYQENYKEITIEKGSIDELMMMMIRGEA